MVIGTRFAMAQHASEKITKSGLEPHVKYPKPIRAHTPLRLRLSVQARLHFAQLLLWQILAFMALLAVFLLHSCDILISFSSHRIC
jgi:hypothetical protein